MRTYLPLLILSASAGVASAADAWPQFRGPGGSSTAPAGSRLPVEIAPDRNVVWKVPLPPGHSSPAVAGGRIFLTADRGGKLLTLALDAATGKTLWEAEAPSGQAENIHKIGSRAQPSPAADPEGKVVVSFFGSSGLTAFEAATGKVLWRRAYGPFKNDFGAASSPVIAGGRVLLAQDHDIDSFLEAVDLSTGKTVWKADRKDFPRSFSTPVVWGGQVVLAGCVRAVGYDLATGAEVWTVRGLSRNVATTPVVGADGDLYLSAWSPGGEPGTRIEAPPTDAFFEQYDKENRGYITREAFPEGDLKKRFSQIDRDKDGKVTREEYEFQQRLFAAAGAILTRIRPGGKGDITATHLVWKADKFLPYVPSPVVFGGVVFTVKNGGVATSRSAADGSVLKSGRLTTGGDYYASPVVADGKLYLSNQTGQVTVLSAEGEWKELFRADFGEDIFATPAVVGDRLFLRTAGHLYCFAAGDRTARGN
jgi:outer membrane protein assembly factor BamB